MRYRRRIITWAIFFVVLIFVYLYVVLELINPIIQQNTNTLAINQFAIIDSLTIPITPPGELNGKTRNEIYELRQNAVMEYSWLIYTKYKPSHAVFSQIEDKNPWWGIAGQYYYGSGDQSILGPAEESRFILNPYLLVAADFSGLSIWNERTGSTFWNRAIITPAALETGRFPFYVSAENLRWWPGRGRVEVTYDLSEYLTRLNHWTAQKYTYQAAAFNLIAYNARDFNLNYLWIDTTQSINIIADTTTQEAIAIPQYLHNGDSCGYPGGCNNMSPATPEIQGIELENLPAKLILYLWRDRPVVNETTPDITYVINIK